MKYLETEEEKKSFAITTALFIIMFLLFFFLGLTYLDPATRKRYRHKFRDHRIWFRRNTANRTDPILAAAGIKRCPTHS